jgi:hypothetical protein
MAVSAGVRRTSGDLLRCHGVAVGTANMVTLTFKARTGYRSIGSFRVFHRTFL